MIDVKVVIGANFGDEGKGLMTDYFCHQSTSQNKKCIVVLSNGGAQRGHTVDTIDGKTHTFHHFGSGTFSGADTYCSQFFILNPMTFRKEFEDLASLGCTPKCFVDFRCMWSTPFDMLVNQIVEQTREDKKHGSCGMGIWETKCRYEKSPMLLNIKQFNNLNYEEKRNTLVSLRDNYFINRLNECGVKSVPSDWKDIFYSEFLLKNFIDDIKFFCENSINCTNDILKYYDTVVCENGQGLLLDQSLVSFYGNNLTPSNTGSLNSYNLVNKTFGDKDFSMELCYVSRSYMTRHGVGRFETECKKESINASMYDSNNVTNRFQDNLRYGELFIPGLIKRIDADSSICKDAKVSVAVTHMNECKLDISKLSKYNIYVSNDKIRDSVAVAE